MLGRIQRPADIVKGLKFLVYGQPKTGKTRLGSTFPKPLLIIGTEDGTSSVSDVDGVEFVRIYSGADVDELTREAATGRWRTVVFDHAGGFYDILLKEVLNLPEVPLQKHWGMAQIHDYGAVSLQFKQRVTRLYDLADRIAVNVVVIAHEKTAEGRDGDGGTVNKIGASLGNKVAEWLHGACDYLCRTFVRDETKILTLANKVQVTEKTGRQEFCLYVGPHETFLTGFRHAVRVSLPDVVVDPDYGKLLPLIKGDSRATV